MKFVSCERDGDIFPAVMARDGLSVLPLATALGRPIADLTAFICTHTEPELAKLWSLLERGEGDRVPLSAVRVTAPIRRPVHDILCVGVNYTDHAKEIRGELIPGAAKPSGKSAFFSKRATRIVGPDEPIESHSGLDERLDYEVELAVIIGKKGRDIPADKAVDYIFGYSVFNDVSARTLQNANLQWFRGKSLDGFAVMGPCIIHRSALPFPLELDVSSTVNGEPRQNSNTRDMIAGVADIIHAMSLGMTLEPGDIIATGTPSGVGMGFDPPRFMKPGDTVCCAIDGVGSISNPIA